VDDFDAIFDLSSEVSRKQRHLSASYVPESYPLPSHRADQSSGPQSHHISCLDDPTATSRSVTRAMDALLKPPLGGGPSSIVRLLQAAAILLTTSAGSMSAALSLVAIPRILDAPSGIGVTQQWNRMHTATQRYLRVCMIWAPSVLHLVLGLKVPRRSRLYYLVACATLSLIPWSYTRLEPIKWKMDRRERMHKDSEDKGPLVEYTPWGPEDAYGLARLWGTRNLYPSAVSLVAGCVGLYAALS